MHDQNLSEIVIKAVSDVLGAEAHEITSATDFHLDLNATPDELHDIKTILETQLDLILPPLTLETTPTVGDLQTLVEDTSL